MDWVKERRSTVTAALIAALAILTFWPVRHHQFIRYDDVDYILENPHVLTGLTWGNIKWAFESVYSANWHPLTWLSHMLDVELFGLQPGWHHLVSLLLHAANSVLLFLLLKRLTGAELRSAVVAALFAVHPLHVESVAWAAERKDVLSALFFLLTLMAYSRYVQTRQEPGRAGNDSRFRARPAHYFFLAVVLYALGLMSKPMLVTLPFLLLLLDFWPHCRYQHAESIGKAFARYVLEKLPFFTLSLGSCLITLLAQDRSHAIAKGFPIGIRLVNAAASYLGYLVKTFWPSSLSIIYPHPALTGQSLLPSALTGAAVLTIVSGVALLLRRKQPWVAVGWFWYLGTLVPVIGLVQAGNQAMADRYTYIPLIGIFIVIVWGAAEFLSNYKWRTTALAASTAAALCALVVTARAQLTHWATNFDLFNHALRVTSKNALAHINVGADLGQRGKYQAAEEHFKAALAADPNCADAYYYLGVTYELWGKEEAAVQMFESTLKLDPSHDLAMSHLGSLLIRIGRSDDGLRLLEASARLNPSSFFARSELGRALAERGDLEAAGRELAVALKLRPGDARGLNALAEVELKRGHLDAAERMYSALLEQSPTNLAVRLKLGGLLLKQGQPAKALFPYSEAVRMYPESPSARYSLGVALAQAGRQAEAAAQLTEAVRLKPNSHEALTELGRALAAQGQMAQARDVFQSAARVCPTNASIQLNLANALALSGQTNEAKLVFAHALELDPGLAARFAQQGDNLAKGGQWTAALARYKTALALKPDDPELQRNVAWLLATHPQPGIRKGAEALNLALSAFKLKQSADFWAALDVSYAELGDFPKAVESAENARKLALQAGQSALAVAAEQRLALYRQGKPFHLDTPPMPTR